MRHVLVTKLELVYDGDFAPKFNSNRMLNTDLNTLGVSVWTWENHKGNNPDKKRFLRLSTVKFTF